MNITIQRQANTDQGTPGELATDTGFRCYTLELPWRDNASDVSCVPAGTYTAKFQHSNHFKTDLYHLQDVPNRSDVMIHSGNFGGDKSLGYKSDILGCILLGLETGELDGQLAVMSSRTALAQFHLAAKGEDITVNIIDSPMVDNE